MTSHKCLVTLLYHFELVKVHYVLQLHNVLVVMIVKKSSLLFFFF